MTELSPGESPFETVASLLGSSVSQGFYCSPALFPMEFFSCLGVFWACFRVLGSGSLFRGRAKLRLFAGFVRENCAIYRHELRVVKRAGFQRVCAEGCENAPLS